MSKDDELFQPEQVDEQIEQIAGAQQAPFSSDARLIHNLRQIYAEDQAIVEHVWTNLSAQAAMRTRQAGEQAGQSQSQLNRRKNRLEGPQPMMNISNAKQPQNNFMRFLEISIAILVVAVLVAGGTVLLLRNARQQPNVAGPGTATPIITPTSAPTGIAATATSTPATAATPTCNTPYRATMTPLPQTTGRAVFYMTGGGGYQAVPSATSLIRYDLATGKQTTLVAPANNAGISDVSLSPDKPWLLFSTYMHSQNQSSTKLQLIRTDGGMLQTLYESCSGFFAPGLAWSPNEQLVAFANPNAGINVLNLTTGQMQTFLSNTAPFSFLPSSWINNQQLLVKQSNNTTKYDIYLLDTSKGVNQQVSNLTPVASIPMFCGNIALSDDGSQLFSSSCTQFNGNCQGAQVQGPSSVSVQSPVEHKSTIIYSSPNRAITAIHPVSASSLLIYIENTTGDLSQDGLWKINTNGSGLTRLTTTNALPCQYGQAAYPFTQITSDSQSYALLHFDGGVQKLVTGSLAGGSPTTIETHNATSNIHVLLLAGIGTF